VCPSSDTATQPGKVLAFPGWTWRALLLRPGRAHSGYGADLVPIPNHQVSESSPLPDDRAARQLAVPEYIGMVRLPPFILASASPRRAELLQQLGVDFQVITTGPKEIVDEQLSPMELCQLNAHRKAHAVAKKNPDALVLGADTLVFLQGKVFGKPKNMNEARQMLSQLQGRTHQVVTGISLIQQRAHHEKLFAVSTDVAFHPLGAEQIRNYLKQINPLDKAGGYAIQEHGNLIVSEIAGSYSNVVGLPLERLRAELEAWPVD
jgi:nucleoside triphosphate pyrophosphatase